MNFVEKMSENIESILKNPLFGHQTKTSENGSVLRQNLFVSSIWKLMTHCTILGQLTLVKYLSRMAFLLLMLHSVGRASVCCALM